MPVESPPRNTRGAVRLAWGVSALAAIAAWAVGCGEPQPPIAIGRISALTVDVGSTGSVDLAGYFSDADGDILTYTAGSSDPGVATAAISGATVQVTAVAAGNATVTVTASDPGGLSADQTFAVTVPNRTPVAVGRIPDAEIFVGEAVEIALASYFDDPDGDDLAYAANSSSPGVAAAAVTGAILRVAGETQGDATVTVTASDGGGLSASQTFAVTVPNRAPEAVGEIDDAETFVGESIEVELAAYFSDPDGDDLAYSATSFNTGVVTASVAGATLRAMGVGQGSAVVTLTATDPGGLSASHTFAVTVPNRAPEAVGSIDDTETYVGESLQVDLAGYFSDADGDILTYTAGSSDPGVATAAISGATVQVTAVAAGNATVTVTASDPGGLSADQTFAVTVPNRTPVAVGRIPDAEIFVGEAVEIALASYFDDPDGDDLAYAANSSSPGVAAAAVTGAILRVAGETQGDATVTVTASDGGGLSASQTFAVTVPNRAPEAVGEIDDAETFVGESIEVELAAYFSDPDGDDLTYSATSFNTGVVTASVAGATLRAMGVGQGSAVVTLTATDPGGLSASHTFAVTVPNRAPEAVGSIDDTETYVGESFQVDLAGYFSDPDGDALAYAANSSNSSIATVSVTGATLRVTGAGQSAVVVTVTASDPSGLSATQTFSVTVPNRSPEAVGQIDDAEIFVGKSIEVSLSGHFSDPDGDALSYSATSSNVGAATISVSGETIRIVAVGQGTATVTVTASDPSGLSATQTFSVTVPNRSPEAVGQIDDAEIFVGKSTEVSLSGYFGDPDGDALSYSATSSNVGAATISVSGETIRIVAVGQGTATVTVAASDPGGLSAMQTFTVTVPNRAPEAVGSISDAGIAVDDTVEIALSQYFSDPDGDDLSYSASSSDDDVATVSVSGATLRVAGVGKGTATVTATATDPGDLSATHTFTAAVEGNRPPVAVGSIDDAGPAAGDTVEIALSGYFSDPDGDELSYAAISSNTGVATVNVSGDTLRVVGVSGGAATVTATATDPDGLSASHTFTATVPNREPAAVGEIDDMEIYEDERVDVALAGYFSDPDGDELSYSASSSDDNVATVSVSGATLRVAGVGKGTATVTATATDPGDLSATHTFTAAVEGNRPPVAVGSIDDAGPAAGDTVEIALSGYFSDPDGDELSYAAISSNTGVATVNVSGDTLRVVGVSGGAATVTATATDPDGLSTNQTFTATVPNRAPEAVGEIDDMEIYGDERLDVALASYFTDPDGDDLSYSASSSDDGVATVTISGDTVAVAGVATGSAEITVTASDGSLSASQDFTATVRDALTDRDVLTILYDELGGDSWTDNANWKSTAPLDDWYGISTDSSGRVATIDLYDNDLSGSIPSELGVLSNLEYLNLGTNDITGSIPAELGRRAANLEYLSLSNNDLTGSIPRKLGDLSSLEWLSLSRNNLAGPIPPELGDLSNFRALYLYNNDDLAGELPSSFSGLTSLETFWAYGTDVCVPRTLRDWYEDIDDHRAERCDFNMDLEFTYAVSSDVSEEIGKARDKWETVLKDTEFTSVRVNYHRTCLGIRRYVGTIDDHMLFVHVDSIDGEGGVLAVATYCYVRSSDRSPLLSATWIDEDDVEEMLDEDVLIPAAFQEMAHALGFPGYWFHHDLVDTLDAADPHFEGELAIEAFDDAGGDDYNGAKVPIQLRTFSHWREDVFGDEIMTPVIDLENDELPVSAITLQSFADIGYTVDVSQADDYELPEAEAHQHRRETGRFLDLSNDLVRVPIVVLDTDGRVVRVIPLPDGTAGWTPPGGSRPIHLHPEPTRERESVFQPVDEHERSGEECRDECDG